MLLAASVGIALLLSRGASEIGCSALQTTPPRGPRQNAIAAPAVRMPNANANHDGASPKKSAIVLIDPVTDWRQVVRAGLDADHDVITVQMPDVALPEKFRTFLPDEAALRDAGVAHALSSRHRDVFSIARELQVLVGRCDLRIACVVPLSEVAVEISDAVASCLGLPHNPMGSMTARRDKGLMKGAVREAGLRVAEHARVGTEEGLRAAVTELSLAYPVVVKTPSGMSTTDVHICNDEKEASDALASIVGGTGPDGRTVDMALLEEYIGGTEFAINLMAFDDANAGSGDAGSRLLVTDMWKYEKTERARYDSAEICNPADHPDLVSYACDVARAVGIRYGAAHVELKAGQDGDGRYVDPVMIEVGARLSGGRKSTMAQAAIGDWDPFASLIESHCGGNCQRRIPQSVKFLTPKQFVRHIFLPIDEGGTVKEIRLQAPTLATLHSSAVIVKAGDVVEETTDIVSCAGFVWLVGEREQVEKDTNEILSSFSLILEDKD